jgi:predicted RNA binding protein YcfA (HicA-like mRNA interferase family)
MTTFPSIAGSNLIRVLRKFGFEVIRKKGSHHFLQHKDGRKRVGSKTILKLEAMGPPRGYRDFLKCGVSIDLAWNTAKSAHGPWRLSRSPGLAFALPAKYFARLGLPRLFVKPT